MGIFSEVEQIEARQRAIAEEMARLQEEASELEIALRVFRRLRPVSTATTKAQPIAPLGEFIPTKLGPPRPNGAPTNFEMVDMILSSAEKEGKDGLTIGELISEMRKRYWPGLNDIQVSASIYAFVKSGRLTKPGDGKFRRVKKNEAPVASAIGASKISDEGPTPLFENAGSSR